MLDDFDMLHLAAQGGMSVVYRARHRVTGRLCAVKRSTLPADRERRNRIRGRLRGGRLQLSHPGILPLLDAGFDDDIFWLATPWVEGGTLDPRNVTDWDAVRAGLLQLLEALAQAHSSGIVHRDVKPQNILVDGDQWLLTDFGILRSMHETEHTEPHGTPSYASPEQIRGETALLRPWSDLYAVGALAWQLVTGRPPFTGNTAAVIRQHLESELPRLKPRMAVPSRLEGWLRRLLEKQPWDRYAYAAVVAARLRELGPAVLPGTSAGPTRWDEEPTIDLDGVVEVAVPPARTSRPVRAGSLDLLPFPAAPPPLSTTDPPPELPRGLRALLPRDHPPAERLWRWLADVVAAGRPRVVDVPDDLDTIRVVRQAVRMLSEAGVGLTLFGARFPTARYLRIVFPDDPSAALGVARSVGVPEDLAWLERVRAGEPEAVADLLCAVGARTPLLAVFADRALAAEMQTRTTGAVLLLCPREGVQDDSLRLEPSQVARLLEQQLGLSPDEARTQSDDGLSAALMAAEPAWLQFET